MTTSIYPIISAVSICGEPDCRLCATDACFICDGALCPLHSELLDGLCSACHELPDEEYNRLTQERFGELETSPVADNGDGFPF